LAALAAVLAVGLSFSSTLASLPSVPWLRPMIIAGVMFLMALPLETASFGLAMLEPDVRVEESIDRADKALLLAKAAGRNRVMTWDPTVTTGTLPEKMLAEGLSDTAER
jgi:hypothetical protein